MAVGVYIQSYSQGKSNTLQVNLESLIVIHVIKMCKNGENITLYVLPCEKASNHGEPLFEINISQISCTFGDCELMPFAKYCKCPAVVIDNMVIAGLASVSRQILKSTDDPALRKLLGFREACLLTCNETSIWTKFCEVDMITTVKNSIKNIDEQIQAEHVLVPVDLSRFENHMSHPVKIHNVYKIARQKNKDNTIKSSTPIEKLNLDHKYGEGPFMTLADVLLFPCFKIILQIFDNVSLATELPLTMLWFENLFNNDTIPKLSFGIPIKSKLPISATVAQEHITKQSLYTIDPKRYKPQNRIYTKQNDVDKALALSSRLLCSNSDWKEPFGYEVDFSWENIPLEAHPMGGALPKSRAARKCEQLQNLAKAVIKITGNRKCTIVDFCSGSGHLGILIALLLPNSHVILVENKEISLKRAKERVEKINLSNVSLVQSNVDYFVAAFDVGMSLHACGVATDLVIQACINNNAHFVCCPCCYGGIHNCHHLMYPRSKTFRDGLDYDNYLIVGHSADQTHNDGSSKTAQGYACMNVIDTDRKLYAEELGYDVHLGKLFPPSCTPKNNLLVGMCKSKVNRFNLK